MSDTAKKRVFTVSTMVVLAVILFFILGSMEVSADSNRRVNERKFFTSYVVQDGDSLWDIAGEYMTKEYESRNEYIEEVLSSNQLDCDYVLYPGQLLILPYYADEPIYSTSR